MKKRFLATILALTMVCALLPATALAADSDFTIEDGVLTKYTGPGGDVVIPDGVTTIGELVFCNYPDVTSVTIPDSVTSIGEFAFEGCTGLTSITIPVNMTSVPGNSFRGCTSLTEFFVATGNTKYTAQDGVLFNKEQTELVAYPGGKVGAYTIPDGVTKIGEQAFCRSAGLTGITIPEGVTTIGYGAFAACESLTSATLPGSGTTMGDCVFMECTSLTSVTIPDGMTSIARGTFLLCTSLTSVTIPDSVTSIGNSAFAGCTGLTSVTIPVSVTMLERSAFERCTDLTDVTLSEGLIFIREQVFDGCASLTSITIPASVTEIRIGTFRGCTSLTDISVDAENAKYTSQDGVLFNKDMTELVIYPAGKSGAYTVPDGVTRFWSDAFDTCAGLTDITIPASVTHIEALEFEDCPDLTVYGYTGTEAERHCAEKGIPFVALPGIAPGTAREGTLESGDGKTLTWAMTEQGQLAVIGQSTAGGLVLAACYDQTGRMTDVKILTAQSITTQIDPATPTVKLFWLGDKQAPISPSVTVWGK